MASCLETGPSRQSSSSRIERSQRASSWERMVGGVGIMLDTIPPRVRPRGALCSPVVWFHCISRPSRFLRNRNAKNPAEAGSSGSALGAVGQDLESRSTLQDSENLDLVGFRVGFLVG